MWKSFNWSVGVICRHLFYIHAFQLAFTNLLEAKHSEIRNYIFGGDINKKCFEIPNWHTHYFNTILSCNCLSLINKPTRFPSTSHPTLLHHIYTNIIDDGTSTGIAVYDIPDHLPTFANLNFQPKYAKKYRPKICCLKSFGLTSFLEDLNTDLYDLVLNNDRDINTTCNNFILTFDNI